MSTVFEVRYDDDEEYHVVARFTDKADAWLLRDRIAADHAKADADECEVESSWIVVPIEIDTIDPLCDLPDLFEADPHAEGHVDVLVDVLDSGFPRRTDR